MEVTYEEFQEACRIVNAYKKQVESHYQKVTEASRYAASKAELTKYTPIGEVGSVRLRNILCGTLCWNPKYDFDLNTTLLEVSKVSINDFRKARNAGKKSQAELQELLALVGLKMNP